MKKLHFLDALATESQGSELEGHGNTEATAVLAVGGRTPGF